ncbi:glycosyl transferase family 2 [Burkholderia sp. WAC0059]|uniref:glycosyltransferase family 2 protein n=1 Tax=Burkholderia sp. WAC0059 TaxID=2066022 RepID=UPI000C7E9A68|nr:glycosyl transferase family 2 [Burkholderia sp. WAC0059]PLZ03575.1 glycosyl transferase family 2 [Burkholderia sp. WAC0059]
MKKIVVVATRARAAETGVLFDLLLDQDERPDAVYAVGVDPADLRGLDAHPLCAAVPVRLLLADRAGSTVQRNWGIEAALGDVERAAADVAADEVADAAAADAAAPREPWFVAFFDDDFRPHRAWLRQCAAVFGADPGIVGLTGRVLADGVKSRGLSEAEAARYLAGECAPQPHWASGDARREIESAYGCNMAFVGRAVRGLRFDESLPLYGWQEDQDYTSRARRLGQMVYEPACRGVHLGVKKGRTSGVRFGYSQIVNPLFLVKKNTMARRKACVFIVRHLLSNVAHSVRRDPVFDYRGRLRGNLIAIADCLRGANHPGRILELV